MHTHANIEVGRGEDEQCMVRCLTPRQCEYLHKMSGVTPLLLANSNAGRPRDVPAGRMGSYVLKCADTRRGDMALLLLCKALQNLGC